MSIMLKTPRISDEAKKALGDKLIAAVRARRITLEAIASITKDDDLSMETLEQDISYLGAGLINECLVAAGEPDPNDPQLDPLEATMPGPRSNTLRHRLRSNCWRASPLRQARRLRA